MKALEAARARLAALEKAVAAKQQKDLAAIPAKYGFQDVNAFLKAVKAAARGGARTKSAKAGGKAKGGRKQRVPITDAMRVEVKNLVEAGKTGAEIGKAVGISLPSVQNIKKALGLVRKGK